MKFSAAVLVLASLASAHYVFPSVTYNGKTTNDWEVVRKTTNFQSNGPVTDVTSSQMTCYQLAPGNEGATVLDVTAGSTIGSSNLPYTIQNTQSLQILTPDEPGYNAKASISHPGPINFYMAKAPSGTSITNWDGSGKNWFKIYSDGPTVTSGGLTWPTNGKATVNVQVPKCIENGDYFLRVEHIALHSASSVGGAQLYISCAQLRVTGGTGTYKPNLMSFPGAYSPNDPGLVVNIYYPVPTNYKAPGGDALTC
ncbi:fungal cellulose binding domain-containing protein [Colletotrichum cuscutae]|uniref:lytic cellulose monooxygenase (C4-dehydrogenating) n=1 Tax=Colletotrichum cuscutae TaxID=1209917 RepID=A0AAI9Y7G5_9PEZI|nr:fungal cellulose binding domain-containing protein [Colletotrichum cuscutae]